MQTATRKQLARSEEIDSLFVAFRSVYFVLVYLEIRWTLSRSKLVESFDEKHCSKVSS